MKKKIQCGPEEVSFWLVKISPYLLKDLDTYRLKKGFNKKVMMATMVRAYLESQRSVQIIPMAHHG